MTQVLFRGFFGDIAPKSKLSGSKWENLLVGGFPCPAQDELTGLGGEMKMETVQAIKGRSDGLDESCGFRVEQNTERACKLEVEPTSRASRNLVVEHNHTIGGLQPVC